MKFMIAGDVVVSQDYCSAQSVDPELARAFSKADFTIVNLEAPVTDSNIRIPKTGPHLKAHATATLDVLRSLGVNVAALANNHIGDYGQAGVIDTIQFLKRNGITPIGAGRNLEEASQAVTLNTPEGSIALINIAENEWASAGKNSPGANGMNLIKDARTIRSAAAQHDYVFVIVHGGHEYYSLPSPRMRDQYRYYAECGASLIVGHHSHCISGTEIHGGAPIFYGLGNFLFTEPSKSLDWYTGLVLQVEIENGKISTQLLPVMQERTKYRLRLLGQDHEILKRVNEYSRVLKDDRALEKSWDDFVRDQSARYLTMWAPTSHIRNRLLRNLVRRTIGDGYSQDMVLRMLNLMRCEAHLDLSREALRLAAIGRES